MPRAHQTHDQKKRTKPTQQSLRAQHHGSDVPSWPPLEPLLPIEDLCMRELLPGQIVTIPSLFTGGLCKRYVSFLEKLPLTTTSGVPKRGEAVRVNDRYQIDDPLFAERLWSSTGLKELVLADMDAAEHAPAERWGGRVLGLNPNIRIYRYKPGHYFDQHYDESNNLLFPGSPATPARTTWTLLLYLTSAATGCVGGETVFYPDGPMMSKKAAKAQPGPEPISVSLETGMCLLHKHGRDCMLHEGREVTAGEKWVIRSDLCVAR